MNKRHIGTLGERVAEAFLQLKGHTVVRRNYRFAGREIDLLTRKDDRIIAVEVKLRRGNAFGAAIEAIDRRKLDRIRVALAGALGENRSHLRPQVDAVVIDIEQGLDAMTVRHIEAI